MRLAPIRGGRRPEIQMAPLIDCIFLLLIFYAVTTQFVSDQRLKLQLPEAKTAESVGAGKQEKIPEVVVAVDGSVWIDGTQVPAAQLEARIRQVIDRAPGRSIILKGDRAADYGIVVHILDLARSAGAKLIQMSAEKPPEK
jgi:biopolymer transport protein ExbD